MNRSWINESENIDVYENGIEEFLQFVERNGTSINGRYYCSYVNYLNKK